MTRVPTIRARAVLDAAAAAALGLAGTIAATGGFTVDVLGLRLGLHSWPRVALAGAMVCGVRLWQRRAAATPLATATALGRITLAATALASIGYWIAYLTTVCGGSDSYGYVSASRLILAGRLIEPQAIAAWLPVAHPLAVAAPVAYVPAADGTGVAPMYPLGLPVFMAVATLVAGPIGPYLVPPLCGLVCVLLAWRLGTAWYGSGAGWLAAALVAWEPLVVTYAKQPMSDIQATMWTLAAVWWLRHPGGRPLAAGVATGLAFLTRPGGLGMLAVVGTLALVPRQDRWRRVATFAAGAAAFAVLQAALQWHLYGSPFRSGYGEVAALYAGGTVWANAGIYANAIRASHGWLWFVGVAAAAWCHDRRPLGLATAVLVVGAVPYLLFFRFDHWETLRFLLPAIALLSIAAAGGLAHLTSVVTRAAPWLAPMAMAASALTIAVSSEAFLRDRGVPGLRDAEQRYPRVAARLAATTSPEAVVLAMQHSGSIRHYAERLTLRWDRLAADELEPVVAALVARGRPVYVALEGSEQAQFDGAFADALTRLRRLPAGQVGNVQIWELAPAAR